MSSSSRSRAVAATDNTFSTPGVTGCGPGGAKNIPVDEAIDANSGLPAASGVNSLTLSGTFSIADSFGNGNQAKTLLQAFAVSSKTAGAGKAPAGFLSTACATGVSGSGSRRPQLKTVSNRGAPAWLALPRASAGTPLDWWPAARRSVSRARLARLQMRCARPRKASRRSTAPVVVPGMGWLWTWRWHLTGNEKIAVI